MELTIGAGTDAKRWGQVMKFARVFGGELIGHAHSNPFFDTREYEVKLTDSTMERYAAEVIASNMSAQVNDEGNTFQLLSRLLITRRMELQLIFPME
jgi:hypothetical protein